MRALGFLAQGEQSPTFDLLTIDGKEFIIARSTRCDAHDTTQCSRSAVPLLVEGERILPVTLESIDGSCGLGASFLVEAMVERATRSGAAELTYGVSLAPEGRALRLRETVRVIERDREGSEIPSATSVIDGELRFHISLRGERWRADRADLLERAGAELGERGR